MPGLRFRGELGRYDLKGGPVEISLVTFLADTVDEQRVPGSGPAVVVQPRGKPLGVPYRHPWGDGCRERLQALAKAHAGTAIEDLVSRVMVPDTLEGARGAYALLFGSPEAAPEFEVVRTDVPGVYAVRETASGSLARLEVIFGVIAEAEPSMVDALRATHFPFTGIVPAP